MILKFDTKNTIWHRMFFEVPEGTTPEQLAEQIKNNEIEPISAEYLYNTVDQLLPDENLEASTIEILHEDKVIWNNGNEPIDS